MALTLADLWKALGTGPWPWAQLVSAMPFSDVVVDSRCRGRGIGKRIIKELVFTCRKAGISWIALVAEPGTRSFYEPLGFTVMEDYTPMKYTGDNTGDNK